MSPPHDVDARPDWELASSSTAADDEGNRAVVYFGEPISSGYVHIKREHLANVTRLEHERQKRAHAEFCRQMGIRQAPL